jgi:hypothetical protein
MRRRRSEPERIRTLHPDRKEGVNIDKRKYDAMRRAILAAIPPGGDFLLSSDLPRAVRRHLDLRAFGRDSSIPWYVTTVKLDLEARGEISRIPGVRPQRLVRGRFRERRRASGED